MESFSKKLVSSDGSVRDKAFRTLKIWLEGRCSDLEYKDYLRLWKALFYCMWMADKPSYQQKLATRFSEIWLNINDKCPEAGLDYVRAFWETICREWSGIDRHRLDKYYFLVKRFYISGFEVISKSSWSTTFINSYNKIISEFPLNSKRIDIPDALRIYLLENYVEIFSNVDCPKLDEEKSQTLIHPFVELIANTEKHAILKVAKEFFSSIANNDGIKNRLDLETISRVVLKAGEDVSVASKNRQVLYSASQMMKEEN